MSLFFYALVAFTLPLGLEIVQLLIWTFKVISRMSGVTSSNKPATRSEGASAARPMALTLAPDF